MSLQTREQLLYGVALLMLLLITIWTYWPGLTGVFLLDDANNLAAMNYQGGVRSWETLVTFVFGNHSGALGRPVAMLSFLLNDQAFPGSVESFRFTNLMLHCLCGIALFVFSRHFLNACGMDDGKATPMALVATAWWLLAPLNVSTTLYVVQRMTQLSALFVLTGLTFYLKGRQKLINNQSAGWLLVIIGLFGFGGLAILSKENGVLIFAYAAACEATLCYSRGQKPIPRLCWVLAVPLLALPAYGLFFWESIQGRYQYREFTLLTRLLTESCIVWDYLLKGIFPAGSHFGLVHDDFPISISLFSPWYTAIALLAHGILIIFAWLYRKRWPFLFFGAAWFYGGHLLESTFIPLELYYEHRNYLPIAGVFLAFVLVIWNLATYRLAFRIGVGILIVMAVLIAHRQARIWGSPLWQTTAWAVEHPDSARAQTDLVGSMLARGEFDQAQRHLEQMQTQWPTLMHMDLLLLSHQCRGNFDSRLTIPVILNQQAFPVYTGNLPGAAEGLMNVYRLRNCQLLDHKLMAQLLEKLVDLPMSKPWFNADIKYWQSEVYQNLGDLNGTMQALDEAYGYSRKSIYRYSQAVVLASAGLYKDALNYIEKALVLEMRKPARKQQNILLYESTKKQLEERVQLHNN